MTRGYMTVRIENPLKKKVMELAKAERRRFSDQVIFLMEKGLSALEQKTAPQPAKEPEAM